MAGRVIGLHGQRAEVAMMLTPDGHSRLEISRFDAPAVASDHRGALVNSLGPQSSREIPMERKR